MKITIKIVLIAFLTGCLFKMPYSYYEITRIVVMVGAVYLGYLEYKARRFPLTALYSVMAILFNPFVKFAFRRQEWQIIDKYCIGILIALVLFDGIKSGKGTRKKQL